MHIANAYSHNVHPVLSGISSPRPAAPTDTKPAPANPVNANSKASPMAPVEPPSASARGEREKVRAAAEDALNHQRQVREEKFIQAEIKMLAARDREVRAHEQAHMAAGGQYAGAATYQYQRGPNGVNYAVGGEVPISTSEEATPEATLRKAQIIRRAALAPAEPSPQDRKIAAMATQMERVARTEIARERDIQAEQAKAAPADAPSTQTDATESVPPAGTSDPEPAERVIANERLERIYQLGGREKPATGTLLSLTA